MDGLRAASILIVLITHATYSNGAPVRPNWIADTYAHFGVGIFFILSGFLITTLLLREQKNTGTVDLKQFYIRRAYRILPVAYLFLVVMALIYHATMSAGDFVWAATYLSSYAPHTPWVLNHLWSLSVEEQFYLLWPLAVVLGPKAQRRFAWATILISPVCRYAFTKADFIDGVLRYFPSVADFVATGCLLALYQPQVQKYRDFFKWKGFPLIWAATVLVPALGYLVMRDPQSFGLGHLPEAFGYSATTIFNFGVALCIQNAILTQPRILNWRPVVWLGALSYSLYIWQMPFFNPNVHSWMTAFPMNIALALCAAVVSFYGFEQPFLRLRARRERAGLRRVPRKEVVMASD
ncbi:MAG TPA: acyltransferase [Candidatus Acidoferrales bacterium]|nr:acyltransferase [Candidatus Acidoferrales bacterium]